MVLIYDLSIERNGSKFANNSKSINKSLGQNNNLRNLMETMKSKGVIYSFWPLKRPF